VAACQAKTFGARRQPTDPRASFATLQSDQMSPLALWRKKLHPMRPSLPFCIACRYRRVFTPMIVRCRFAVELGHVPSAPRRRAVRSVPGAQAQSRPTRTGQRCRAADQSADGRAPLSTRESAPLQSTLCWTRLQAEKRDQTSSIRKGGVTWPSSDGTLSRSPDMRPKKNDRRLEHGSAL